MATTEAQMDYATLVTELARCFALTCREGWKLHPWATVEAAMKCAGVLGAEYVRLHPDQRAAVVATLHHFVDAGLAETGTRRDAADAGDAADDEGTVVATRH